jgi:hypothetical protein
MTGDVISETHIRDNLYHIVEKNLSIKNNQKELMMGIVKYADKWSHLLLSTNFSERMLFNDYDKEFLYKACGLTKQEVAVVVKGSEVIKSHWNVATNPFYILSVFAMKFFYQNKLNDEFLNTALYLSYPLFISSHYASFRKLPSKEVMEYTINHLSNRYIIKQQGTIQGMLEHTVLSALEGRYIEELIRCTDADIKDVIYGIEVRVGFNMKNIADEFYKNHKNEKYIFLQSDVVSETEYHIADNMSYAIGRVSDATSRSVISEGFDFDKVITRATNINAGSSPKKLKVMMDTIIEVDRQSINAFIVDVVSLYMYKSASPAIQDLKTLKFLSESLQIYKSNAQDEITTRIKETLLKWIDITSSKYGRTFISMGKTSIDTYKRAIYCCFMLKIMEISKGA